MASLPVIRNSFSGSSVIVPCLAVDAAALPGPTRRPSDQTSSLRCSASREPPLENFLPRHHQLADGHLSYVIDGDQKLPLPPLTNHIFCGHRRCRRRPSGRQGLHPIDKPGLAGRPRNHPKKSCSSPPSSSSLLAIFLVHDMKGTLGRQEIIPRILLATAKNQAAAAAVGRAGPWAPPPLLSIIFDSEQKVVINFCLCRPSLNYLVGSSADPPTELLPSGT